MYAGSPLVKATRVRYFYLVRGCRPKKVVFFFHARRKIYRTTKKLPVRSLFITAQTKALVYEKKRKKDRHISPKQKQKRNRTKQITSTSLRPNYNNEI